MLKVARNGLRLMQDPFGNYVVQYVLKTCSRCIIVVVVAAIVAVIYCGPIRQMVEIESKRFVVGLCRLVAVYFDESGFAADGLGRC